MPEKSNWLLLAATEDNSYIGQTHVPDNTFLYRALTKWLIRGSASKLLHSFWEYIDQYDNELENALLDQFLTQADHPVDDPQTTNVRTRDYSVDMTVLSKSAGSFYKTCHLTFVLYVYFHSLKTKVRVDEITLDITLLKNNGEMEKIVINTAQKTPAPFLKTSRRVSKRSSKTTPTPVPVHKESVIETVKTKN